MVTQRTDETNPGVCPPLPLIGLRLGQSLKRLGVDRRHRDDGAFGRFRQGISGGRETGESLRLGAVLAAISLCAAFEECE
jgi:hypothetical protein